MTNTMKQFDNLDDRREIHHMLARLSPTARVAFVDWCCARCCKTSIGRDPVQVQAKTRKLADLARVDDSADKRLSFDLYFDLWFLAMNWGLDLGEVADELTRRVRLL